VQDGAPIDLQDIRGAASQVGWRSGTGHAP
jgi:hypothetical protein